MAGERAVPITVDTTILANFVNHVGAELRQDQPKGEAAFFLAGGQFLEPPLDSGIVQGRHGHGPREVVPRHGRSGHSVVGIALDLIQNQDFDRRKI